MGKIFLALFLLYAVVYAQDVHNINLGAPKGADGLALKALVSKSPAQLEPEIAVMVGTIFQNGMQELHVKKNIPKAKLYFKSAGERGVAMGDLLLANIAFSDGDIKNYVNFMEKVIRANDDKLSIISGQKLAAFWISQNNIARSFEPLLYIADVYDDPKSQFMIGWSIISEEFIPSGMSQKDGQFYLYQACNNNKITKEIQRQCDLLVSK